jgi:hypothetical protein
MTFSAAERAALAARVRYELGYSALTVAGEPYFAIAYAPEVALDSLYSAESTTSVTTVSSTTAPTTITLALGTGFFTGGRIHVDAGARREVVVAQYVSGTSLTALFTLAHSGTYSVEVESGEAMLRTILGQLDRVQSELASSSSTAGIKKADEVEFFNGSDGAVLSSLTTERNRWRDELGSLLKLPNLHNVKRGGATQLEAY